MGDWFRTDAAFEMSPILERSSALRRSDVLMSWLSSSGSSKFSSKFCKCPVLIRFCQEEWVELESRAHRSPLQNVKNLLAHFVLVERSRMGRRMNGFHPPSETWGELEDRAAVWAAPSASLHCPMKAFGMWLIVITCCWRVFSISTVAKSAQA